MGTDDCSSVLNTNHTFVVCAYGECPFLQECVESVVHQTESSNVLLSTSTDNDYIRNIANKYQLKLYINPGPGGMQENWNFGVSCAKTDYVTVCHQDDFYHPDYYKFIKSMFDDDVLMLYTGYYDVVDGKKYKNINNRIRRVLSFSQRAYIFQRCRLTKLNALRFGNSICCPSCTYHVSKLGQPIFRSQLSNGCDWDLYVELANKKGAMVYVPKELCYKRTHATSATANDIRTGLREKEDLYMFKKVWPDNIAKLMLTIYKKIYKYSM